MSSLWHRLRIDHRQRSRCSLWVACVLTMLFAGIARETPAEASANVSVELLSERAAIEPGMPFRVGLLMRMRPGWHTYWKNPGDSGLPLRVTWNLPEGFSAGPIDWPTPERIPENGLMSYGYSRDVLIPIEITPPERIGAATVTMVGTFEWLECKDVCLPGSSVLRLSLPVRPGSSMAGPDAPTFAKAASQIPGAP